MREWILVARWKLLAALRGRCRNWAMFSGCWPAMCLSRAFTAGGKLAHLWLVPNPAHNPNGDFGLGSNGLALNLPRDTAEPRFTFSTIALYRKDFFRDLPFGNPGGLKTALAPLLRAAMDNQQVSAELYEGAWTDVGTPARLAELNQTTY
jgi:MurNAc alpha-1-phosphate uridylyltransferase